MCTRLGTVCALYVHIRTRMCQHVFRHNVPVNCRCAWVVHLYVSLQLNNTILLLCFITTHTHTHTHTHTLLHVPCPDIRTQAHTCTQPHAHTHAHTHTHIHWFLVYKKTINNLSYVFACVLLSRLYTHVSIHI